jgi:hypothetical protein
MKRGGPLKRSTPLKPKRWVQRACSGKPGSAKRKPRDTGPSKKLRDAVLERDSYTCQRCGRYLPNSGLPYSLQHRLPRGRRRTDANTFANLVTLCGDATSGDLAGSDHCHAHVESYRRRATREGWLVPSGINPEDWPVLRFGEHWSMPGEPDENGQNGWVECEPYPGQQTWGTAA